MKRIAKRAGFAFRAALLFAMTFAGPMHVSKAQDAVPGPLDLSALTLTPADLNQPGFFHDGAFYQPLDEWAENLAAYRGGDSDEVRERLEATGWERKYFSTLRQPADGDPGAYALAVTSYVTKFRDAAGAAAAFVFTEDESAVATASDVQGNRTIGERSEITHDEGISGATGQPFVSTDLAFQLGSFNAGVTLYRYETVRIDAATPVATPISSAAVETVERLASILGERLLNRREVPGLGPTVLRLEAEDRAYISYDDAYYRLDGTDIPILGESDAATTARTESYASATDVYQLWQGIDVGEADGLLYAVTLFQFPSDTDAAQWLTDAPELLARNPSYRQLTPINGGQSLGDESMVLTFTPRGADPRITGGMVITQVGAVVVRLQLAPSGNSSPDLMPVVAELARQQVDCVRAAACVPVGLPEI